MLNCWFSFSENRIKTLIQNNNEADCVDKLQTYCEGDLVTYLFKRSVKVRFVGGWVGGG